jgi:hypothetical protein
VVRSLGEILDAISVIATACLVLKDACFGSTRDRACFAFGELDCSHFILRLVRSPPTLSLSFSSFSHRLVKIRARYSLKLRPPCARQQSDETRVCRLPSLRPIPPTSFSSPAPLFRRRRSCRLCRTPTCLCWHYRQHHLGGAVRCRRDRYRQGGTRRPRPRGDFRPARLTALRRSKTSVAPARRRSAALPQGLSPGDPPQMKCRRQVKRQRVFQPRPNPWRWQRQ